MPRSPDPAETILPGNISQEPRFRRLAAVAAEQNGCLTTAQMRREGLSYDDIEHRVEQGLLHPVRRAVYFLGHAPRGPHGPWHAAVLSVGEDAMLSGISAAQNYGAFRGDTRDIHVTVARKVASRDGIRVHCVEQAPEPREHRGIPTSPPEHVALDLARQMYSPAAFRRAIKQLQVLDLATHDDLLAHAHANRGARGVRTLRTALGLSHPRSKSLLEDAVILLAREHRLPSPEVNVLVLGMEADLFWPRFGLVVEVQSWYHETPTAQEDDRLRRQVWEGAGMRVLYVGGEDLGRPHETVQRLRSAM